MAEEKGSQPQTVIEGEGASEPAEQPSELQETPSPCEPRALEEPSAAEAAPKAVEPPDVRGFPFVEIASKNLLLRTSFNATLFGVL